LSRRARHRVTLPRSYRDITRRPSPHPLVLAPQHKRALKRATFRDCGRRCVYCATLLPYDLATLDHVFPVARGGTHTPGNLVSACAPCNRLKGDLLPHDFFGRYPWAGTNFMHYARAAHRALKRSARRAVSLAYAEAA
jgi:5-methylcytosine-specific restriction endonuclease McrA